jgi:hypothetical protein
MAEVWAYTFLSIAVLVQASSKVPAEKMADYRDETSRRSRAFCAACVVSIAVSPLLPAMTSLVKPVPSGYDQESAAARCSFKSIPSC